MPDRSKLCTVCHKPIGPIPGEHPNVTARRKYHPGECQRLGTNAVRNERLRPTRKSIASKDLSDYSLLSEVTESCGVTTNAVLKWLQRRKKRRFPYYFVYWKRGYVRNDLSAEYAEARAAKRPAGWVSVKGVLAELRYSKSSPHGYDFLHQLEAKGLVQTQRTSRGLYISPDDAALLLRTFRSAFPLPGWTPLQEAAARSGVTPTALTAWAKRNDVELRFYKHPEHFHVVLYLETKQALRYLALNSPQRKKVDETQLLEAA